MQSIVRDESVFPTIPCPPQQNETLRSLTMALPEPITASWVSVILRNKIALRSEIVRLEQEFARASRKRATILERTEIWASLLICRSLLLSFWKDNIWVEESTVEQQLRQQAMKRAVRNR